MAAWARFRDASSYADWLSEVLPDSHSGYLDAAHPRRHANSPGFVATGRLSSGRTAR